jgi:NADH-quinone oxidoreductase subunit A
MAEYLPILIFFGIASCLALIIVGASYLLAVKNPDPEKVSVYECGFDPFGDSRQKFEVRFFLIGILFIIFDLEISFLFPWSIVLLYLPIFGYWTMCLFLFILTVGLFYEWNKGGLEWE